MDSSPPPTTSRPFRVGDWLVDPTLDEISRAGLVMKLEPRMVRLLARLAETPGEVVSTRQLLETVWPDVVVGPASVYQAISHVRKLLGDTGSTPTCIATVPRKGYRLIAVVRPPESGASASVASLAAAPASALPPKGSNRKWIVGVAVLLPLLAMAWLLLRPREDPQPSGPPADVAASDTNSHTIAILPFRAESGSESNAAAASSFFQLLHDRLGESPDTRVINRYSVIKASANGLADAVIGEQLHARYLIHGEAGATADSARVRLSVFDTLAGREIWSKTREAPLTGMADAAETLARQLAQLMRVTLPARETRPVDPYAYPLYAKGQVLLGLVTYADNQAARELFTRSIAMDPDFARGHLGLGQALTQLDRLKDFNSRNPPPEARQAIARALELDPALGAGWSERALMESDPARAEQLHLRGLSLSPNEVFGYWAYADYLKGQKRFEEAISMLDRARAIDPLLTALHDQKKFLVITQERDLGEYEHLLRQTVEIAPDHSNALFELGAMRFYAHGELAQGLLLAERAAKAQLDLGAPRFVLSRMYLELRMPEASRETNVGALAPFLGEMQLAMYFKDVDAANKLALANVDQLEFWQSDFPSFANAVRDHALATRALPEAVALLDRQFQKSAQLPLLQRLTVGVVLAHTLQLAGQEQRGVKLARDLLAAIDAEVTKQGSHWWGVHRAMALVLLGDDESALAELEALEKTSSYMGWWYIAERDPVFDGIRRDARFSAIVARAKTHLDQQLLLVGELVRKGEIPRRPAG
jgi:DNA-binding winged helix-turn-helix (wHTH) protein/TolB-like protein